MKYKLLKEIKNGGHKIGEIVDWTCNDLSEAVTTTLLLDLGYIKEYVENGKFIPEDNTSYFYVGSDMEVYDSYYFVHNDSDKARVEIGNAFITREEAEEARDKIQVFIKKL